MAAVARRIRGLLGVSAGWGASWAILGAAVGAVLEAVSPGTWQGTGAIQGLAVGMGLYGMVSGLGFGQLLASYEKRKALKDLSLPRVTLWGVAGSAAVPLVFGALGMFEPGTTTVDVLEAILLTSVLGGSFAAGSLALARRSSEEEGDLELASGPVRAQLDEGPLPDPLHELTRERRSVR